MSTIYGDPNFNPTLFGNQHAKNQILVGIDNQDNTIIGDVDTITDLAKGGNDSLTGGNNTSSGLIDNELIGDANFMSGSAQGGNDIVTGGNNRERRN
jgi:hypothetical protein